MDSAPEGGGSDRSAGWSGRSIPAGLAAAFEAGGEMGGLLRAHDWAASPLGEPSTWPPSLLHAVGMMLASRSQIVMFWGDEYRAFYNDAYLPTIGAKHPYALGQPARRHWSELWHVLEPLFAGVRESGRAYQARDHPFLLERHGYLEETYFDISYDPLRLEDGAVGGIFCIVSETTRRVLGERRLRALAELATRLSDAESAGELGRAAAGVLTACRADVPLCLLHLRDWSPGADRIVTYGDVESLAYGDVESLWPPAVASVLDGGPATTVSLAELVGTPPATAADEALVLPVTAGAEPVGALVVGVSRRLALDPDYRGFLDLVAAQISTAVTAQRAAEQERARAADLAALDRAKTAFFANVSHEFRTPLTLVLGPVQDLLADPMLAPQHRDRLTVIHRNAQRLLKLVNTVLDFARLESGRQRPLFRPTDLGDLTSRLISTFRSAVDRVGLRLTVECPPLPEPVYVDRDMWEKIVLNLISNALKFTFEGGISVRLRAVDGGAELDVTDTGVGIGADQLGQIFERFHRVPGIRSRTREGTGIGLALVRELSEMHGGTVSVRSRVDEGSTFTVRLPFGTEHLPADRVTDDSGTPGESEQAELYAAEPGWWSAPEPTGAASAGPASAGPASAGPASAGPASAGLELAPRSAAAAENRPAADATVGRILLADDNADLRDHVARLLAPHWRVMAVPDGQEAFDAAVRHPFDLVLTDVMMPRLDGFELLARLRNDPRTRHLPVIILTARAGSGEELEGLSAGADDYLVKPFSSEELLARVRSNIELGQLRGQIIRQLRALADAAVAVNSARSTADVLKVAAQHALALAHAGRVVVSTAGARYEADGGGGPPEDPSGVVPLLGTTGEQLGELRVWPPDGAGTDAEQTALAQLARLVGVRLENARLYEAEHRIATTLQHSFLPASLPRLPGAVVASRYLPGNAEVQVGGDWYDVVPVGNGRLALAIGDVVGKGVVAAAAMGQLRNALRAYALEGHDPGAALTRLNRLLGSTGQQSYATVVIMSFEPDTGRLRYASAGHPPPLLIGTGGGVAALLHERALGPPIGTRPDTTYQTLDGHLAPGERLLLYTDGLIEDRGEGIDVGLDRLRTESTTGGEHVEDLLDRLLAPFRRRTRHDDIAVLALEAAEPNRFALRLPADPTRLSVLRKRLEDFLTAHGVGETDMFDLAVAVSEAAANAIEHPLSPAEPVINVEVAIEGDEVIAVIRDTGHWRAETEGGFRGRGLGLIRALAELSVDSGPDGTRLTLRRQLDAGPGGG